MKKKGQISVFIILGIFFLLIIGLLLFYAARPKKDLSQKQGSDLINYIEQCLLLTTEEGLKTIGMQGGYITLPEIFLEKSYADFAYGYNNGRNKLPGLNNIQDEIELYIRENINNCLGGFKMFPQYEINQGDDIRSEVIFTEKNTISRFTMPLDYKRGEEKKMIDEFSVDLPLRFRSIYDLAFRTMDDLEKYPGIINLTFLEQQDIDVNILTYDDSFVYVFEDRKSYIEGIPYRFILGVDRDG